MRKFFFAAVFLLLLPTRSLHAQTGLDSLQMIYDSLDVANIPSGILWDRTLYIPMLHPDPQWYDGTTSARQGNKGAFYDLLGLFNIAAYHDSIALPPPVFYDREKLEINQEPAHVPLAVMHYDYQEIDSLAIYNGEIGYDTATHKYYDIPGGAPYNDKKTFLGASMRHLTEVQFISANLSMINYSVRYKLPDSLYITNVPETPELVEIDFADGNGFVPVLFNEIKTVTYNLPRYLWEESPYSGKTLRIRMHFNSTGGFHQASLRMIHSVPGATPDQTIQLENLPLNGSCVVEPEQGFYRSEARAYIQYAGDTVLNRPVIFVEGFDSGTDPYGNQNWPGFSTGYFATPHSNDNLPQLRLLPNLVDTLNQLGYDVIIVDFKKGVDDMRNNGATVIRLIQWVNEQLEAKGIDEQIVVTGASMGGVIARYALLRLEDEGCCHNTRLYATLDSPHREANIPLGVQAFLRNMGYNLPIEKIRKQYEGVVRSPAAKQLLGLHVNSTHNVLDPSRFSMITNPWANPEPPNAHLFHEGFYNKLNAMGGHPANCRRLGIVNGSVTAQPGPFPNGAKLMDMAIDLPAPIAYPYDFDNWMMLGSKVYALDQSASHTLVQSKGVMAGAMSAALYAMDYATYMIGWVFKIITFGTSDPGFEAMMAGLFVANDFLSHNTYQEKVYPLYDNAPGSNTNTMEGIAAEINHAVWGLGLTSPIMSATRGSHTFINSLSALDIKSSNLNMHVYNALANDPTITPFDGIWHNGVTEAQPLSINQEHVRITPELIRWLSHELEANRYPLNTTGQSARYKNLQTVFNYGRPELKFIYQLDVGNNGKLFINSTLYGLDYDSLPPPEPGTHFTAHTNNSDCSDSWILIKNGGLVELGDNISNSGELIIQSGTYLEIQSGGVLRLSDHSRVLIEEGADLVIHPDATIELNGNNAMLEIQGRLVLKENAVLAPLGTGIVRLAQSGMDYVNAQQMIVLEGNNYMDFSGTGKSHKRLEIGRPTFFRTELDSLVINNARVELDSGTFMHIRSPFISHGTHYTSGNEAAGIAGRHNGVRTYGQERVDVSGCDFTYGKFGLLANMNILGHDLFLEDCTFKYNDIGLSTLGKSVHLVSCRADSNNTGWQVHDYSGTNIATNSGFDYNSLFGINAIGQYSTSLTVLSDITADWNDGCGIAISQGALQMHCASASNNSNYGILAMDASLLMPDYSSNNFNSNDVGILFSDLNRLAIRNGQNSFSGSGTYHLQGTFSQTGEDNLYFDAITATRKLDVTSNLLPASGGVIPISMTSPSHDPLLIYNWSANPSWAVPSCSIGPSQYEPFCCGDSAGKVETENYADISLNLAFYDAASYMTDPLGTTPGQDLTATRRFAEVFDYIAQNPEGWNAWEQHYMDLGWNFWQRAAANAYRAGDIELNRGEPETEINADLLPLIEEADRRIQNLDPESDNYVEEKFRIYLEKAQLYRLGEYHTEGLAILGNASQWSSEGHLTIANYWNCVCENELDLLTEEITVEDFENQINSCIETWSSKTGGFGYPTGEGIPVALAMGGDNSFRSILLPNPSQGHSTLSFNQNASGLEVKVTNFNNTWVHSESIPKDQLTVELDGSSYPGGVYIISVYDKSRLLETHKWILTE